MAVSAVLWFGLGLGGCGLIAVAIVAVVWAIISQRRAGTKNDGRRMANDTFAGG